MDPATMQQILQAIKGIKGEIPISDIILGIALAGLVGEKIWMAVLKAKANGRNGKTTLATEKGVAERLKADEAIENHYKATTEMVGGVDRMCTSLEFQKEKSIQSVVLLEQIANNTAGLGGRRQD